MSVGSRALKLLLMVAARLSASLLKPPVEETWGARVLCQNFSNFIKLLTNGKTERNVLGGIQAEIGYSKFQ